MKKLLLGAGEDLREGWLRQDADWRVKPDYQCDFKHLADVVPHNMFGEIEWIHGPASVEPWELPELLKAIRTLLTPAGKLIMETPDAREVVKIWAADPRSNTRHVYGDPQHAAAGYMNRWAYTPDTLTDILDRCGYTNIAVTKAVNHLPGRDFRIEACR